jgi:hypothetical protein
MVTINDLETGVVARVSPPRFARLAGKSPVSVYRDIKQGLLMASTDQSGRIFIPAEEALRYLRGEPYKHARLNEAAIARMERARAAKGGQ